MQRRVAQAPVRKETIKRIDWALGNVLCAVLTAHRRVADLFRRTPPVASPKKILFLKLIEQGATVLAAPAMRRAVERVGRENVFFWVFTENRPIVDILGLVPQENVIELRHRNLAVFALDVWRGLRRIRLAGVDTVVDMELMARAPAILAYLTGATWRVGLHRFTSEGPYRGDLMTHRVQYNPYLHTSIAYSLLVEALEQDSRETPMPKVAVVPPAEHARHRFVADAEGLARVEAILDAKDDGWRRKRLVILNPNTGDLLPLRMWEADRFVELGRRILEENADTLVVVTGAPSEKDGAADVTRRIGVVTPGASGASARGSRAVCVAGETSLRDVLVLYTLADVLVTNDSGPGHFASMTDIHNVVLFGPETPQLFGPIGENRHVIWARLACSPCVSPYNHRFSACADNRCMQAITVEQVYREVAAALAKPVREPAARLPSGEAR